jgi:hypothetical protein
MPPESSGHSTKSLRADDAVVLLRRLARFREDGQCAQADLYRDVITSALNETDARREAVFAACGDLKLFVVHTVRESRELRVSWTDLQQRHERGTLFVGSPSDLARNLAAALANQPVWLLAEKFDRDVLGKALDVPKCDEGNCIDLLARSSLALATAARRLPLLKRLALDRLHEGEPQYTTALRYLMHGSLEHRDDEEVPLLAHAPDIWSRLANWCSEQLNARWRILELEISTWWRE